MTKSRSGSCSAWTACSTARSTSPVCPWPIFPRNECRGLRSAPASPRSVCWDRTPCSTTASASTMLTAPSTSTSAAPSKLRTSTSSDLPSAPRTTAASPSSASPTSTASRQCPAFQTEFKLATTSWPSTVSPSPTQPWDRSGRCLKARPVRNANSPSSATAASLTSWPTSNIFWERFLTRRTPRRNRQRKTEAGRGALEIVQLPPVCHPERSDWCAKRTNHAVEGPLAIPRYPRLPRGIFATTAALSTSRPSSPQTLPAPASRSSPHPNSRSPARYRPAPQSPRYPPRSTTRAALSREPLLSPYVSTRPSPRLHQRQILQQPILPVWIFRTPTPRNSTPPPPHPPSCTASPATAHKPPQTP